MFTRRRNTPPDEAVVASRTVRNSIRPPSGYTRQEHMNSYLQDRQLSPSTRKVSEDDATHDTVFQSVAGDTLILRVHWPGASAQHHHRPPEMTLAGVEARHPWLDRRMRVTGYAPLQGPDEWRDASVLLGAAVHAVIQHLQLNPPHIVQFVDQGLIAIQTKPVPQHQRNGTHGSMSSAFLTNGGHHSRTNSSSQQQQQQQDDAPPAYDSMLSSPSTNSRGAPPPPPPQVDIDLPTVPSHFPQLDSLSRDQLETLQSDDLEFKAFCNRLPLTAEYHEVQRQLLAPNAERAARNLDSEVQLRDLHDACAALQKQLQSKVKTFQTLERKQDGICQPPAVHQVCRDLQKAKKAAFEDSEQMADEWLKSDDCAAATDDFLQAFLEARKVHHRRAAKLELLEQSRR